MVGRFDSWAGVGKFEDYAGFFLGGADGQNAAAYFVESIDGVVD